MALLKIPISSRLINTASRRTSSQTFFMQTRRYTAPQSPESAETTTSADPPAPKAGEAELTTQEKPGESMSRHQPDYSAAVDYRTRYCQSHIPLTREPVKQSQRLLANPKESHERQRTRGLCSCRSAFWGSSRPSSPHSPVHRQYSCPIPSKLTTT